MRKTAHTSTQNSACHGGRLSPVRARLLRLSRVAGVAVEALLYLWRACCFRALRRRGLPAIPAVAVCVPPPSRAVVAETAGWVDLIVGLLLFWRPGCCFYRAYAMVCVLRRRGVPAILNFGYRNLTDPRRRGAHCWVTLSGVPVAEPETTLETYCIRLGEGEGGTVFWVDGEMPEAGKQALAPSVH